jgi:hypothetical protein
VVLQFLNSILSIEEINVNAFFDMALDTEWDIKQGRDEKQMQDT